VKREFLRTRLKFFATLEKNQQRFESLDF